MCRTGNGRQQDNDDAAGTTTSTSPLPSPASVRLLTPRQQRKPKCVMGCSSSSSSSVLLSPGGGQRRMSFLPLPLRRRRHFLSLSLTLVLLLAIWRVWLWGDHRRQRTVVIVITPTHKRPERLADMTRFAQTLMHVPDLHWVVIEDANFTVAPVERILQRSGIPFAYFFSTTRPGFPRRGWTHRNVGLDYVRKHYRHFNGNAVVYFADDDNTYDIRLFQNYIKKVRTIGVWAVGLAGAALVEAPRVDGNGTITGWDVVYAPQRRFATDMAGFAVNLELILSTNASFHLGCVRFSPESCFLAQFGIPRERVQPFGWNEEPKDVLVWHTKTKNIGTKGSNHGYVVEQ